MKVKNKIIIFFLISIFLGVINIKNPIKTKFYLFTSKTEQFTLGNLITITFLSGLASSSILSLLSSNNTLNKSEAYSSLEKDINNSSTNKIDNETISDRPPERDIRESQPTISVNYRFVDSDINSYKSKINENNVVEDNDWVNMENEW